jgi:hypothetical protein
MTTSCSHHSRSSYSLESFLKDRNAIGNFLNKSFTVLPEGATLTTLSEKQKAFDATFPGDSHIRNVVKRQLWSCHSGYFFTLNLSETMLSSHDQSSSITMTATQLLNHFFSGLSNYGFRNKGTPADRTEFPLQYASNTWFKENSNSISIFGSVYVNREDKTALIVVNISEVY